MALDPRFLAASGREVFTGNELLVKGCLEVDGGVHLMTGYPGSPVAGFFDCLGAINKLIQDNGIRAFQANNEALGAAAANGSQMAPCRAVVTMKSVGLHVAMPGKVDFLIKNPKFSKAVWDVYLGKNNVGEAVKKGLTSRL